ncbi:MAG: ABC transporter ATP-binding protein [Cryobacterium sp.]|nr:ABC transporter ATP-binding protein [Cryobacterium sp.]
MTTTSGAIAVEKRPDEPAGTVVLDSVTKIFGESTAVDNISLRVEPGEFLSLLGPSGCGKTTTLRMLAGFETPNSGSIRISGEDVLGIPPYKRNVNTVFQAYALFPHLSVAENVAYGLQQKKVPKAEVREKVVSALEMVKMRSFADRKPTQLSGGQQQRIALARALVNQPAVLLLDEPLGALDRQLREEMQLELKLLQSQLGITFIFVTHDQGEALSMSDRIAIMREGKIEQLADAETIYSSPTSAYVAGFIGQQNFFEGTLNKDGNLENSGGKIRAAIPLLAQTGTAVRAAIRPEDITIDSKEPGSQINAISGSLVSISHLGETLQYLVDVGDGHTVLARRPRPGAPRLELKSKVWCTWNPESVLMFHAHDESPGSHDSPEE